MNLYKQTKHLNFFVLLIILFGGIVTFAMLNGNKGLQFFSGLVMALAYVAWGLVHHASSKTLYLKVVIEYMLIAAIAVVLLATLLF